MQNVLPAAVYANIQEQYRSASPLESDDWQLGAEEDALTGAFAKGLRHAVNGSLGEWEWKTQIAKLRGSGPGAPEKCTGADMLVEIVVGDAEGQAMFQKGMIVQAKKNWKGKDGRLQEQATLMEEIAPGAAAVVDYRQPQCVGADARSVVMEGADRRSIKMRPWGDLLADEFLPCSLGQRGLLYDGENEVLAVPAGDRVVHLARMRFSMRVTTKIFQSGHLSLDRRET